jgi:hypothetical protein
VAGCGPKVKVVDIIPKMYSGESHSDSEPNIAVNPENPRHIVVSAFTPCPPTISTTQAPIYFSKNGGETWHLNCILPGDDPSYGTNDITLRFAGSSGVLYAGILNANTFLQLNILRTADFSSPTPMTLLVSRDQEDQPYTQALGRSGDHVYIGNNNISDCTIVIFGCTGTTGQSSSVDPSLNAATAPPPAGFSTLVLEDRPTCGQDLPPIRAAIHQSGTIYMAYLRNEPGSPCFGATNTADVVVARDDSWGTGGFKSLVDPSDGKYGVLVATGLSMTWLGDLGTERVGAQLSISVDPKDSQTVYVAWGDGADPNNFTLHLRRSLNGGKTWSGDLKTITPATNPALAINDDGRVGFLYQKLVNPGTCNGGGPGIPCWETHFERLKGNTWKGLSRSLANVPDNAGFFPLGDYEHLLAIEDKFYGVFCANNYPDKSNFYPGIKYHRHVDWNTHTLYADAAHTIVVSPSVDPYVFIVDD